MGLDFMDLQEFARRIENGQYGVTLLQDGTGVLLDIDQEAILSFNATGACILAGLRAGADEPEIVQTLVAAFAVNEPTAAADVAVFVARLAEALRMPTK